MFGRVSLAIVTACVLVAAATLPAGADELPSGERMLGKTSVEPVYNDETGSIGYLQVPTKAPDPAKANSRSWAPIYLPVYPVGAPVGTLNCMHTPVENCPSHGYGVSALAQQVMPGVYGGGVLGHDHLMDFPGGSDFNVAWEPIVVLFTNTAAANEHIVTDAALEAAVTRGDAIEIPLPQLTFYCTAVPARLFERATPVV
jgi:hypothetical protein